MIGFANGKVGEIPGSREPMEQFHSMTMTSDTPARTLNRRRFTGGNHNLT
jgi:hypothetical protein